MLNHVPSGKVQLVTLPICLDALLLYKLKELGLAKQITPHSATSTESHRRVLVTPMQSKSCVIQVGSTVVCTS